MPRWLSSLMIVIGFLALVAMALLPKNIWVNVEVNTSVKSDETINHNHAEPSGDLPPLEEN